MLKITKNTFKNKVVIASLASLIILIGSQFGLLAAVGITSVTAENVINIILTALTALGVLTSPLQNESADAQVIEVIEDGKELVENLTK